MTYVPPPMRAEWGLAEYDDHPMGSTGEGAEHTAPNCEGFRLRGPWRGPSVLTSALSRLVRGTSRARTQVRKPLIRYTPFARFPGIGVKDSSSLHIQDPGFECP